jgi:hypothetical protein
MSTPHSIIGRAEFLTRIGGLLAAAVIGPSDFRRVLDETAELEHPEPREGITGDHVLAATALGKVRDQKVVDAYEAARAFPAIFDGIACGCSCSGMNAKSGQHRSLLVCGRTLTCERSPGQPSTQGISCGTASFAARCCFST